MNTQYNGVLLAYIGDGVLELLVREKLIASGETGTGKLSAMAQKIVCAPAQSEMVEKLLPLLSEEELAADKLGKYKTTFQDVSIVVLLVSASVFGKAGEVLCMVGLVLFAIATVLTVWSGISYVVKNKQVLKDQK